MNIGNDRGEPRSNITKSGGPQKVLPIEIPSIPLAELNRLTGNFGSKAFIGEGSYGRVYYAKMNDGIEVAIKRLDTSSSPDSDSNDFAAQVRKNYLKQCFGSWSCHSYCIMLLYGFCSYQLFQDSSMTIL